MINTNEKKPTLFVSACLLGKPVRFDGGHKRNKFVAEELNELMDIETLCPEVESGMSVPRPTIHLRDINNSIRLTESRNAQSDFTDAVTSIAKTKAESAKNRISGMIVQKKSPSCGLERVAVSNEEGKTIHHKGVGLFTHQFMKLNPIIPVEEDGRLNDAKIRENFLERVYALNRWYQLEDNNIKGFIDFHIQHKFILMARGKIGYAPLGRLVSKVTKENLHEVKNEYIHLFMDTLKHRVSRNQHFNVLQHIMGYFKKVLSHEDKKELLNIMNSYRSFEVPLSTPVMLLNHYLRQYPHPYIEKQNYLKPYPDALALRSLI